MAKKLNLPFILLYLQHMWVGVGWKRQNTVVWVEGA